LFQKIAAIGEDKYDLAFLTFVKNFTINAINKKGNLTDKDDCLYGITLLWEYIKDEGKKLPNLVDTANNFFIEVLKLHSVDDSIIKKYMTLSLDNIKYVNS
jgi:hypothetical protein